MALGDMLTQPCSPNLQFSGASAEQMRKTYSEFCSRHTKALKLYKELYARDKRFQQFIRVSKPLQDTNSASLIHGVHVCAAPTCRLGVHQPLWTMRSWCPHGSRARALHYLV